MPKVTIALGSILAVAGIICFLALFGPGQSETIRSIGSAFFALGVLIMASGVYLQARRLRAQYQPSTSKPKKTERLCASCNREPALVFCRVHVLRLCLACFEQHDDGSKCSYVPAKRATAAYK
jgi:Na+/melibiose symporter-like transporter